MNDTKVNDAHVIDIVISMYNLIKHNDNCSKRSGSLWQYRRDEPNDTLIDSKSIEVNIKATNDGNKKDVEIAVPL